MRDIRHTLRAAAAFAVATLAAACASDDEAVVKPAGGGQTVTLTAYQPGSDAETRVGFGKDGAAYWQEDDVIGIMEIDVTNNWTCYFAPFSITGGIGESTATFRGNLLDTTTTSYTYAVYPYNDKHKFDSSGDIESILTYWLPDSYTYTSVDQTYFPADKRGNSYRMPMYGLVSEGKVKFTHLGAVFCLKVDQMPAASGTVTVTEVDDFPLCHGFKVSVSNIDGTAIPEMKITGSPVYDDIPDASACTVTFSYSNAVKGKPGVFYLPVATGGYRLQVTVAGGDLSVTKVLYMEITRGKLKVVNIDTGFNIETEEETEKDNFVVIDGHNFVDLGLTSGTLWAETNIGAATAYDDGNYYSWGETQTKSDYSQEAYTYEYSTVSDEYSEYNTTDKKTTLELDDDAAYKNWGTLCRTPTKEQFEELCNSCTWTWKTDYTNSDGKKREGFEVTSKTNGRSIFLPASGFYDGSETINRNYAGYYMTNTCSGTKDAYLGFIMYIATYRVDSSNRYDGLSVRPVAHQ